MSGHTDACDSQTCPNHVELKVRRAQKGNWRHSFQNSSVGAAGLGAERAAAVERGAMRAAAADLASSAGAPALSKPFYAPGGSGGTTGTRMNMLTADTTDIQRQRAVLHPRVGTWPEDVGPSQGSGHEGQQARCARAGEAADRARAGLALSGAHLAGVTHPETGEAQERRDFLSLWQEILTETLLPSGYGRKFFLVSKQRKVYSVNLFRCVSCVAF